METTYYLYVRLVSSKSVVCSDSASFLPPVWWKTDNKFNLITLAPHQTTQIPYQDPGRGRSAKTRKSSQMYTKQKQRRERSQGGRKGGRMNLPVCPLSLVLDDPYLHAGHCRPGIHHTHWINTQQAKPLTPDKRMCS